MSMFRCSISMLGVAALAVLTVGESGLVKGIVLRSQATPSELAGKDLSRIISPAYLTADVDKIEKDAEASAEDVEDSIETGADAAADTADEVADETEGTAEDIAEDVEEGADATEDAADDVGKAVDNAAQDVGDFFDKTFR